MTGLRTRPAIASQSLTCGWGRAPLLRELSMEVGPGERLAILGPNGAGKTTLFDALAGRLRPVAGRITLAGEDVTGLPLHRRARRGLGYVPQEPSVFGDLTVAQNLEAARTSPAAQRSGPADPESLERGLQAFALTEVRDRFARLLSGGERRRVEVLRAFLCRPAVLLLDEPFAGLDPKGRSALRRGLETLPPRTALLITDHAADDLLAICERVLLIVDGELAFDGPTTDFSAGHPAHRRYFGG